MMHIRGTYQAGENGIADGADEPGDDQMRRAPNREVPAALSRSQNPPAVDVAHTTAEESKDACGHRRQAPRAPSTVAGVTWR